ncbi:MAG: pseudouridine synthase [Ignavibacteriae bacterium]|nr:MAG: pseudouridine synthase [Ignavibacteriota bacterium]
MTVQTPSYILFYKPYGVLSQFTREAGHLSLADFGPFPKNIYAAGRLDADSEGLLFLTDDADMNHRLTDPKFEHERTYLVQVEGVMDEQELEQLQKGVLIEGKLTKPATVKVLTGEPDLPMRAVPIRYRKTIPASWIELVLHEGRNRQVRKMTASVGHPTLRLVRTSMTFLSLDGLSPGEHRPLTVDEQRELFKLLHAF